MLNTMRITFALICLALIFSACCRDHSDIIPGQDFIPDDILDNIIDNGQPIFEGLDPPVLDSCYLISPLVLVQSNFDDEVFPGHVFLDETVCFENFNEKSLQIDITNMQANTTGEGEGSFISGSGDDFTIYVKILLTDTDDHEVLTTTIYSGTVEDGGIRDMFVSIFVIDDNGDPNGIYIENGQGRLLKDDDGFSPSL